MQTIGERLEEARKKKGISIREAAEATKIRGDYLQKFEGNHFDIGLTEIYTRGFLRTYANYLKIPSDRIISDYAALGRGDTRPRQPNREVYGRMDISIAHADSTDRNAPPPEPVAEPSPANRGPNRTRAGTSLPTGPDPALVFKYVKIGGAVVIVLVLLWIIKALFFSGGPTPSGRGTSATTSGPTVGLVALRPVQIKLARPSTVNPDADGEIVYARTLAAGSTITIPWIGGAYLTAEPATSVEIILGTQRRNLAELLGPGVNRGQLPAPP